MVSKNSENEFDYISLSVNQYIQSTFPMVPNKTSEDYQVMRAVINLLKPFYQYKDSLSFSVIRDLDIINGEGTDLITALEKMLPLKTKAGKSTLLFSILYPTVYTADILQRQVLVQFFLDNPELIAIIDPILQRIASNENQFISAFNDKEKEQKKIDDWSKISLYETYIHKNSSFHLIYQITSFLAKVGFSAGFKILPFLFYANDQSVSRTILCGIVSLLCSFFVDVSLYSSIVNIRNKSQQIHYYLGGVLNYLNSLSYLVQIGDRIPLCQNHPLFLQLHEVMVVQQSLNEMRHFLQDAISAADMFVLHNWANIALGEQKLKRIDKDSIASICGVIGELDLVIAIARAISDAEERGHHRWCFAQFEENNIEPLLILKNSWHPLLLHHKNLDHIVCNDISFVNGLKNVILTGPNASGKTAITTGFATAIILAQSIGFVPADKCVLTPYSTIFVVFAAKSESGAGQSRFTHELTQVQNVVHGLRECVSKGKFAFVVLDELFTGTNSVDGEAAAKELLKLFLEKNLHSCVLMMLSTHYQRLTEMAHQSATCANYKVEVDRQHNGTVKRTYTLLPGVSLSRVALDMFKESIKESIC